MKKYKLTVLLLLIIFVSLCSIQILHVYKEFDINIVNDELYDSIEYDPQDAQLRFTIPANIPKGYKLYLHISGRLFMENSSEGRSFHAFDEESIKYTWEEGKTYTYPLESKAIDYLLIDYGLKNKDNRGQTSSIKIDANGRKIDL